MSSCRKTTRVQFETFERECLRLQKKWGLLGWHLCIVHEDPEEEGACADITPNLGAAQATIRYSRSVQEGEEVDPRRSAKHEMLHLLTARLYMNGAARCVSAAELQESWESLVRRLEKLL